MEELNPSQDTKINKYALDEDSANIAHLIYLYDEKWNKTFIRLEKLDAQIKNLEDELKNLRQTLGFKARKEWKVLDFDKQPTDKLAESWAYTQEEYKEKFNIIKQKREERAEVAANEALYKNYHFQLLEKSKNVDLQFRMWGAQYSNTKNGGLPEKDNEGIRELTKKLNRKIKNA